MFLWSTIAHMIAVSSPGPDTAIVIRQVNIYGRSSGYKASLGISIGVLIHCLLAVNGISILIISSDINKLFITLIGSFYLIFIGLKTLSFDENNNSNENNSLSNSFLVGLITNIFNFKAFLFFISIFTILIEQISGIYLIIFPLYFSFLTLVWFCFLSYLLTINENINLYKNKIFRYCTSLFLCLLGLFIIINFLYEH
tara:strand:- start:491 stop:1084 length:594 start_codon:yes stop_codon:yes gene_type:complete